MARLINQPYLPQMSDGVITQGDLESTQTIYVVIRPYTNVRVDDFIVLHFGSLPTRSFLVIDPNQEVVATFNIDAATVPDGEYLVWYEVIDAVGNLSGPSPSGWAIVNRNDNGVLDAPVFIDADGDHIIDDASVNNYKGTHVAISAYVDMAEGDTLNLLFYVTDGNGDLIDNSQYAVSHTVTASDVGTSVISLIPAPYITVPDGITCYARYRLRQGSDAAEIVSLTGEAHLSLTNPDMLPAPIFTDAIYGWLMEEQVANGIRLQAAWTGMTSGEEVMMDLSGFAADGSPVSDAGSTQTRAVTAGESTQGFMSFTFDKSAAIAVNLGRLNAWYTVNSDRTSVAASVNVDMVHAAPLPPPQFLQAQNGQLDENSIIAAGNAEVYVTYPDMTAGDTLSVYITGKSSNGSNVPGATALLSAVITEAEIAAGGITMLIPQDNALAPAEQGTLTAQYTVDYNNNTGFAYSSPTEVILIMATASTLTLVLAVGSPIYDDSLEINPENKGILYGPPGAEIALSCSEPAIFVDSGSNIDNVTIERDGEVRFALRSPSLGQISVLAYDEVSGEQANASTLFNQYGFDSDAPMIQAWGVSSGSVADNVMPCSVYMVVENNPELEHVHAEVIQGSATLLETGESSGDIQLNPDKSITIGLVDINAENVQVRMSLPEGTGNVIDIPLHFVAKPVQL
jgi:hypothetical protein